MITDQRIITPATIARPKWGVPVVEAGYGSKLTRIGGDVADPIVGLSGETWDLDSRHGYSKRQPVNCDGTLAFIEQRHGSPTKLILDARTWIALKGNTGNLRACTEVRWHPQLPKLMVGYNNTRREIVIFDVMTDAVMRRIPVPFVWTSDNGGFMGEGSLSRDGSVVCFGDKAGNMCLIDIPNGRVGPMQKIDFVRFPGIGLDNITVSPLSTNAGGYVVAHSNDLVRVFKYGTALTLTPHFESDLKLSHADVGVTPAGREVFVGGARQWYGAAGEFSDKPGNVVAIDLLTGVISPISAGESVTGKKEASDQHCSCRGADGWVCVTYAGPHETSGLFCQEIVLYKLDGSRTMQRMGITRTNEGGAIGAIDRYRNEAHAVQLPSKPGEPIRVMFASNWQHNASPPGNVNEVKSFVYESSSSDVQVPPVLPRFYIDKAWSYGEGALMDRSKVPHRLVTLLDIEAKFNQK